MSSTSVVTLTDAARGTIARLRAAEPDGNGLALRLDVVGETATEFAYELTFEPVVDAKETDHVERSGDLPVIIPADSVDKLRGATLDDVDPTGLVLRNPNRPETKSVAAGTLVLEGTVEERLQQLLDNEINPMLASHGGFATLDRVEGDVAYLGMGGGCQGCGLAKMTLTEGIKTAIEDAIPEITKVVDITDHAAGENPFFAPA
jgi:Fe/S biogenesis protein NfuA